MDCVPNRSCGGIWKFLTQVMLTDSSTDIESTTPPNTPASDLNSEWIDIHDVDTAEPITLYEIRPRSET